MRRSLLAHYLIASARVPGWFYPEDIQVFDRINQLQGQYRIKGNLLEIGSYHGKSAILLGYFPRRGERLVVCDLFHVPGQTVENRAEQRYWYSKLTRAVFERNYLRFHNKLPVILTCPSTKLLNVGQLSENTFRFIHVDGSHVYSIVRRDLRTSRGLLRDRGIVAIDDYRSVHTPGVAAAVWEEVARGDLIPLCLTPQKMYATWDIHNLHLSNKLRIWAQKQGNFQVDRDRICGRTVVRIRSKTDHETGQITMP